MYRTLFVFFLGLSILACKNNNTETVDTITDTSKLKGLPLDIKQNIVNNCDYIDYTFYDLNFSMSQSDAAAINANIALLSDEIQESVPTNCNPIGRKYYHVNGEIVMEAELYYAEGCLCYIYKKGNTVLYGNKLSPGAITFYTKIFSQAGRTNQGG